MIANEIIQMSLQWCVDPERVTRITHRLLSIVVSLHIHPDTSWSSGCNAIHTMLT